MMLEINSEMQDMSAPYWLNPYNREDFPDVALALREPDGLLAIGGDLSTERLLSAYQRGIFPWYSGDQPVLWWSPDPRSVLVPKKLRISRSLSKTIKNTPFRISLDEAFTQVIHECAQPRAHEAGTWITHEMNLAYIRLHEAGHAHSVECWQDDQLLGGLYGVAQGKVFFGESMFSRASNASKIAFVYLTRQLQHWNFGLIDCQIQSAHLDQFGAENVPRNVFVHSLEHLICVNDQYPQTGRWTLESELVARIVRTGGKINE
ncbi:Leucyl/phenylalanyl-tRNA--protein transferase [hydrothermal vent metagenome]|uniref:Leucyl/phenylalanyl-tRNA--protein transferase n=1 Tax=hydrothermal vent metagenome TaxID=652676 RepID=A0A3B1BB53_9ZZZZ